MRKLSGAAGPSITFAAALIMLFASVASLLLANSLRGQLEEAQGQLQDTQSELQTMQEAKNQQQKASKAGAGPITKGPGVANKTQPNATSGVQDPKSSTPEGQDQQAGVPAETPSDEGSRLPSLLLLSLGLVVLASIVLAVTSALALVTRGPRLDKSVVDGSGASAPSHAGTSNLERESLSEDGSWSKLVEECVGVVDELDEYMSSFDTSRREVAEHVVLRLEEILGRSGVDIISNDVVFDRVRHKPEDGHAATGSGAVVRETLSPGFAVGPRVLRRARVRLE